MSFCERTVVLIPISIFKLNCIRKTLLFFRKKLFTETPSVGKDTRETKGRRWRRTHFLLYLGRNSSMAPTSSSIVKVGVVIMSNDPLTLIVPSFLLFLILRSFFSLLFYFFTEITFRLPRRG